MLVEDQAQNIPIKVIDEDPNALIVKASHISGAGMGLFTATKISKGAIVCEYKGECLRTAEAMKLKDKSYLMRLGDNTYIDAMNSIDHDIEEKHTQNSEEAHSQ